MCRCYFHYKLRIGFWVLLGQGVVLCRDMTADEVQRHIQEPTNGERPLDRPVRHLFHERGVGERMERTYPRRQVPKVRQRLFL
jgi:hypothetical protein